MGDRTMLMAALALAALPCCAEEIPALRVKQEILGFPGLEKDQTTSVVLFIARDRLAASQESDKRIFIVRLDEDEGRMYEIAPDRKTYSESADSQDRQKERDIADRQLISILREEAKNEEEFQKALATHHLRADGKRIASIEEPEGEKEFELDGVKYKARQVIVTENGRRILDAWYAPLPAGSTDLAGQIEFYEFFRRLGCFSDQVLAVLKSFTQDHRGIPLEAQIRVVTVTLNHVLKARTVEFAKTMVPAAAFELPPGAVKVEKKAIVKCALPGCPNEVEVEAPAGGKYRDQNNRWHYFCSTEHRTRFAKDRIAKARAEAAEPKK